jgi:nicotinamidase/pyrazinamidase
MKKALILIDIQNDFVPGGALTVPNGDAVVPVANALMDHVDLVVATQDWHPTTHGSFVSQHPGKTVGELVNLNGLDQVVWPDHCVENSEGADFVKGLNTERIAQVIRKGTDAAIDSYSGFFDNGHRKATGLEDYLKKENVTQLIMVGLATDYCVKFTALDARKLGFDVVLVTNGVKERMVWRYDECEHRQR